MKNNFTIYDFPEYVTQQYHKFVCLIINLLRIKKIIKKNFAIGFKLENTFEYFFLIILFLKSLFLKKNNLILN